MLLSTIVVVIFKMMILPLQFVLVYPKIFFGEKTKREVVLVSLTVRPGLTKTVKRN
jgi:hypothetical protein